VLPLYVGIFRITFLFLLSESSGCPATASSDVRIPRRGYTDSILPRQTPLELPAIQNQENFFIFYFPSHLLKVFLEQRRSWKEVAINSRRPPDLAGSVSGEILYPNSFLCFFFFFFFLIVHSALMCS
jgi:hypothetical protein